LKFLHNFRNFFSHFIDTRTQIEKLKALKTPSRLPKTVGLRQSL